MKKKLASALLLALSLGMLCVAYVRAESGVIRMHIVAESDSETHQAVKLRVRSALLPLLEECLAASETPEADIRSLLPLLEQTAESIAGVSASATLAKESFPARFDSGSFLPAGRYTTLRVVLGEGQGHNWWSVVYPEEEEVELRWWFLDWWSSVFRQNEL